ncbi:MAG: ATP-binding protein, partial [Flavobacteriales bacterium]
MSEDKKKPSSTSEYGAGQIQALEGMEHVRMRPSMYIGDVNVRGLHHLVYEVVDNSIDEALAGHCDSIDVWITKENGIRVKDNGRGIPVGMHEKEGVSALQVVMTKIGAGGKFDKDSYKVSGGLHGVGVSCVNALSILLRAEVHRDGKAYEQEYKQGNVEYAVRECGTSTSNGTIIEFLPDPAIFEVLEYNYDTIADRMRELSFLNQGITVTLTDERELAEPADGEEPKEGVFKTETFFSENGLRDFVNYLESTRETLIADVIHMSGERAGVPVEVAMTYNTSYSENLFSYVNNINTYEGGTHLTGFRRGLTNT